MTSTAFISKYINSIFDDFPKGISVLRNKDRTYPSCVLINDVCKALNVNEKDVHFISLVIELIQFTIDIHSKIALLPETDVNNKVSILGGDLLFSHALEQIPNIKDAFIRDLIFQKITSSTKADVLFGMMAASQKSFRLTRYKKIAKKKTGSFTSLCFTVPIHYSNTNKKILALMEKIGLYLGMIRQMLQEIIFFKRNELTNYNIQHWYFPYLVMSRSNWKKELQKNNQFKINDSKEYYINQIKKNLISHWICHQRLIEKLPSSFNYQVYNACKIYLKDLSPEIWLNYA